MTASRSAALSRYLDLASALESQRRWFQQSMTRRYASLLLAGVDGTPREIATRVGDVAEQLRAGSRWFSVLRGELRFLVAALLVREDLGVPQFHGEIETIRAGLRSMKLRRGEAGEIGAALLMRIATGASPGEPQLRRFRDAYDRMRQDHYWLTGVDDYPACALFAVSDQSIHTAMRRVEAIYQRLVEGGVGRGGKTQLVSHLLCFGPGSDEQVTRRFLALRTRFAAEGIAMWRTDYDELGLLAFLDGPSVADVVRTVIDHRRAVRTLRPKPGPVESFSLATGTAFTELAGRDGELLRDAQVLVQVNEIFTQQQAAAAGGAGAA